MKRTFIFAKLLIAVATAASAQTTPTTPAADTPTLARFPRLVEYRLNLTDAQRVQVKSIIQQERPAIQQLAAQLKTEHAELIAMPAFDEAQTRAFVAKYADVNTALVVERIKLRTQLRAILTPAQQQKLDQLRARFGAQFDQRLLTLGDNL